MDTSMRKKYTASIGSRTCHNVKMQKMRYPKRLIEQKLKELVEEYRRKRIPIRPTGLKFNQPYIPWWQQIQLCPYIAQVFHQHLYAYHLDLDCSDNHGVCHQ